MKRKSINEKEISVILAIIDDFREHCHYRYDEMNKVMGSITIQEMNKLYYKLDKWKDPAKYDDEC